MNIDEMIAVLQAAKEGKKIQFRGSGHDKWEDTEEPIWDFYEIQYRVKPEPREVWVRVRDNGCLSVYNHLEKEAAEAAGYKAVLFREVI